MSANRIVRRIAERPLGMGMASLGNYGKVVSLNRALATVHAAHAAGIRYFDVAPLYGHGLAEHRLGMALHEYGIDDAVLSTKVGRILNPAPAGIGSMKTAFVDPLSFTYHYDYSHDAIMRSFEDSLQRLGRARIDILYVHNIDPLLHDPATCERMFETCMNDGCRALETLRASGTVGAIGVGNNSWQMCRRFLDSGSFNVFLLAGGYNLLDQAAQTDFLDECKERGARVVIGAPFASGVLAGGPIEETTYAYKPVPPDVRERVNRIARIAESYGTTLAAAALQFPLAHPAVCAVIPSMVSPEQVSANCAAFEHKIPNAFWDELKEAGALPVSAIAPAQRPPRPQTADKAGGGP